MSVASNCRSVDTRRRGRDVQMAAFDSLPPPVRVALREATLPYDDVEVAEAVAIHGEAAVIGLIRRLDAEQRALMYGAYARGVAPDFKKGRPWR